MKRKIGVFLILLGVVLNVKAQAPEPNPIQTGVPLLLILSDARAAGQGDVGVATTSDANSIYHNSAKMAFNTSEYSVGVNYTPWLQSLVDGLFVGGGSIINRIDERSAWGADIRYFSLGDIDLYDDGGNSTGSANPYEFSASGSYALKLSDYFSMGVALRYMRSDFKITGTDQNLNTVNG
ncbi:MAG: PorV/PorQ family protein, partial [Flavicella sp.]|nr:PorV/PorQ family protein [Flavicella sp.]